MRRLALLAPVALALLAGCVHAEATERSGVVARVVDGDTVDVRLDGGGLERVRLIGIDTPERGACGAARATSTARRLAQGRRVTLRGDPTQDARDRHGRLLAYVWIDGRRDLGLEQLRRGNARVFVYRDPFARLPAYLRAARGVVGCPAAAAS